MQETLDSLSAQTLREWQCIAIDDGSSDATAAILWAHANHDPRFTVISRPNRGLIATLNEAIALARRPGLRAWMPTIWPSLNAGGATAGLVAARSRCLRHLGQLFFGERSGLWQTPVDDASIKLQLLFNVPLAHPSVMVRASLLRETPYDATAVHAEDYALWCALAMRGARFINVPRPLLRYRCHAGQITQTKRDELRHTAQRIRSAYAAGLLPPNIEVSEFARYAEPGTPLSADEFTTYAWMLLGLAAMYPAGAGVLAEAGSKPGNVRARRALR